MNTQSEVRKTKIVLNRPKLHAMLGIKSEPRAFSDIPNVAGYRVAIDPDREPRLQE